MISLYRLIASALVVACAGLGMDKAAAENAEREKCTCDTQLQSEPNNGAWVKNATACWSTEDRGRQWCDITVQSLEGPISSNTVVGALFRDPTDSAALVDIFHDQFQQFAASSLSSNSLLAIDMQRATKEVPALLKENESRISSCVTAFRDATFGKAGIRDESDGFRCSVGETSGWLRIEFRIGDLWIAYMLAPNA